MRRFLALAALATLLSLPASAEQPDHERDPGSASFRIAGAQVVGILAIPGQPVEITALAAGEPQRIICSDSLTHLCRDLALGDPFEATGPLTSNGKLATKVNGEDGG